MSSARPNNQPVEQKSSNRPAAIVAAGNKALASNISGLLPALFYGFLWCGKTFPKNFSRDTNNGHGSKRCKIP